MAADFLRQILTERLAAVEERISRAAARAGRARRDITLLSVTKTVSARVARVLAELGVRDLAENRPQELWRKAGEVPADVHWHLIGHLQRNKIERTVPLVRMIHSVDSLRLLAALEEQGRPLDVLLEVNASGEESKGGFSPDEVIGLAESVTGLRQVRVCGLMTMAALEDDAEKCRPTFVRLRQLRDRLRQELGSATALEHLSMGMSNDFETAIEEGATLIRLGTLLVGGLPGEEQG